MAKSLICFCISSILIFNTSLFSQDEIDSINTQISEYEPPERFGVWLGWFGPSFQSLAQVNSQAIGIGPIINLERSFQLPDNESLLRFEAYFRINKHHSVYTGYYTSTREGRSEVTTEIKIGDLIIPIGSQSYAKNDISLLKIGYRYSIVNTEEIESGIGLGFSILFYKLFVESKSTIRENTENVDQPIPIPILNIYTVYHIWNRFDFLFYADLFGISIDIYDGSLIDFALGIKYRIIDQLAAGINYNVYKLDVRIDNPKGFDGRIDYFHRGLTLYLFYGF